VKGEESIYKLIPSPEAKASKPPRYTSKFSGDLAPTYSTFGATAAAQIVVTNVGGEPSPPPRAHAHKQSHANFGPKNLHYADPTTFLKKASHPPLPPPAKHTYAQTVAPKAALVKKEEKPVMGLRSNQNFVHRNAVNAVAQEPKKLEEKDVRYAKKPDYGKVPDYLLDVKKEVEMEKTMIDSLVAQQRETAAAAQPKMRLLPEAERLQLLEALKLKWETVNAAYQTMTHNVIIDSQGKIRRKEQCEQELFQLERSIEKLNKKFVYVNDD